MVRNSLVFFTLFLCSLLGAEETHTPSLQSELVALNAYFVEETTYCPDEPIILRYTAINIGAESERLSRCPYPYHLRVSDEAGLIVWDSEEARRRREEKLIAEQGIGEILTPTCTVFEILPGRIAEWRGEWDHKTLDESPAPPGTYQIEVRYGLYSDPKYDVYGYGPFAETIIEIIDSESDC